MLWYRIIFEKKNDYNYDEEDEGKDDNDDYYCDDENDDEEEEEEEEEQGRGLQKGEERRGK